MTHIKKTYEEFFYVPEESDTKAKHEFKIGGYDVYMPLNYNTLVEISKKLLGDKYRMWDPVNNKVYYDAYTKDGGKFIVIDGPKGTFLANTNVNMIVNQINYRMKFADLDDDLIEVVARIKIDDYK